MSGHNPVEFHQDAPALSPSVLPRGDEWPAILARAYTSHATPSLTKNSSPNPDAPAAIGSGKRNSNRTQPTDGQTTPPSLPADQDSDVTLVESIGESDGDSDYVESTENSPTIPDNTLDLAGHISELEEMHEVTENELVKLTQPTVLSPRINELELSELDDDENDPPENHQDNGATPPVNTQPSPPHSTLEYTSVASAAPPPHPRVEAGNAALQSQEGDLPDVRLLGADYMLYGVYQDWVHKNLGYHLDGGIAEASKWQARCKNLFVCQSNAMTHLLGNL